MSIQTNFTQRIKIIFDNETKNIIVKDGILKKSMLKDYFPEGGTLSYTVDNETYLPDTDNENIYIPPNVDTYNLNIRKVDPVPILGVKRRARFYDILNKINSDKQSSEKRIRKRKVILKFYPLSLLKTTEEVIPNYFYLQLTDQKIGNKKQEMASMEDDSPDEKSFLKRIVHVGWKHRNDFQSNYQIMGSTIGPKKVIIFNGNEEYPLQKLKMKLLNEYVDEYNKFYFDSSITVIGKYDETSVTDYTNKDGHPCGFWEFGKDRLRKKGHGLLLYLLTTKLAPSEHNINSDKENIDSFRSILEDKELRKEEVPVNYRFGVSLTSSSSSELKSSPFCVKDMDYFQRQSSKSSERNFDYRCGIVDSKVWSEKEIILGNSINSSLRTPNFSNKTDMANCQYQPSESAERNAILKNERLKKKKAFDSNSFDSSVPSPEFSELTKVKNSSREHDKDVGFKFVIPVDKSTKNSKLKTLHLSIPVVDETDIEFSDLELGKGGQGIVTKGKFRGSHVAIKTMPKSNQEKLILREIQLMNSVRHANIISVMAVSSTLTQFHIVMEFFDSNCMYDILFNPEIRNKYVLDTENKNRIAYQISCAITYLHLEKSPIIHRDIKPSNILINQSFAAKLCDLGLGTCKELSTSLQSTCAGSLRGTYLYMAPEILLYSQEATESSDVWSFACTLMELYEEKKIWPINNFSSLMRILTEKQVPPMVRVPAFLTKKVQQCFQYDNKARPKMSEILHLFEKACDPTVKGQL